MFYQYPVFYRLFGVRRLLEFRSPRIFKNEELSLPRNSLYHYSPYESNSLGPDLSDTLISADHQLIPIYFKDYLAGDEGIQRRKVKNLTPIIRSYIKSNHNRIKYHKKIDELINTAYLSIMSYSLLNILYVYKPLPMKAYNEWYNFYETVYTNANDLVEETKKNQFIIIEMPNIIPSRNYFNIYQDKVNKKSIFRFFNNDKSLNLLDIWRWINPETRSLSTLKNIKEENFKYINFIFRYENYNFVLNLEKLYYFMTPTENNKSVLHPTQLQKLLLRSVMALHEAKIKDEMSINEEIIEKDDPITGDIKVSLIDDNTDSSDQATLPPIEDKNIASNKNENEIENDLIKGMSHVDEIDEAMKDIDKDLEEIDKYYEVLHTDTIDDVDDDESEHPKQAEEKPLESVKLPDEEKAKIAEKHFTHRAPDSKALDEINKYKELKIMNATDYKSNMRVYNKFQEMPNPYTAKSNYNEYIKITPEDVKISHKEEELVKPKSIVDDRMAKTTISTFDKKYLGNVITKDTLSMVKNVMNAGILIDNYNVEEIHDALGDYEVHTVKVKPIIGSASVIHFKLPIVNSDGEMTISGKKYYLRKQRADLPIRKINDSEVALTSYYGKLFVRRDYKVVNNLSRWLSTKIRKMKLSDEPTPITKVISSNVFNPKYRTPRLYSALAKEFFKIETSKVFFFLDYEDRYTLLPKEKLDKLERDDKVLIGFEKATKYPIFIDYNDDLLVFDNVTFKHIESFYDLVGINLEDVPIEHITLSIFSKDVPVVIVLGYLMGLTNLINLLDAKHRLIPSNKQPKLDKHEYVIKFEDYKLILDRREIKNSLILGALVKFKNQLKTVKYKEMDDKDVYFDFYKALGLTSIYIKETDLENQMFIDPITLEILKEMKEPETFVGLLMRSAELLTTDDHPSPVSMDYMRIRGYERIPGAVYKELITSLREQRNRSVIGKSPLSMNPFAVWKLINSDPTVTLLSDINPIQNLKQQEGVTFAGIGGRNKDTIMPRDRIFDKSDIGFISESTADGSDVGVNTYLTANPAIKNLRGMKKGFDYEDVGSAGVLSTSSVLAPGATNDDPKRTNFISIQNSHTVGCEAYKQSQVRTGYEGIVGQRTKSLFCLTAKKNGKVISLNDKGIIVEYEDGERVGAKLGRFFGNHEGSTYPHDVITKLKLDQKVTTGMAICYNTAFFEPDFFDERYVVFKTTITAKTVLWESSQTYEDSSSISRTFADKLATKTTKVKSIVVNFKQNILNLHKLGNISYGDPFCFIEDELTSSTDIFNEENMETLKALAKNSPLCKYNGTLDKIEVYYHGDKDDMSESLLKITNTSDKNFAAEGKSSNSPVITGRVNNDYRVDGIPMQLDTAEIKFYVTIDNAANVGDKGVFSNQLKSVFGEVREQPLLTEDGEIIDAAFGSKSVAARIVISVDKIGTTITLLRRIAELAVEKWET